MSIFLFTDIENSTRLWEKHGSIMGHILSRHDELIVENIERQGGKIIKHRGDGFFAVFESGDPLASAVAIQKAMQDEKWKDIGELRVRIALHAGPAEKRGEDYFGSAVNRTARILDIGWGGQILVTAEFADQRRLPEGAALQNLGFHLLKDLHEPQQMYGLIHPDIRLKEFPPLRSLSNHPNNLPTQSTPFIGRGKELHELTRLLASADCRLVTLLGPGGIGKTRLAMQAASEQIGDFAHGAYFVDLAPLGSSDLLVSAIAQSFQFTFYGQGDPKTQLFDYLREKKMLLVLDNFEHLLDGAPLVSEILAASPHVKIIVTSRERLNLKGEWLVELEGLQVPLSETNNLESYAAIQLFVQTAQRVSMNFSLTEKDAPFVVYICQLLSGMPLGIELAASWVRSMSCEEIAGEISSSLDFLATQLRDTPERHRSLRAVFDHSWKLLSEYEKSTLKKIALFRGGFAKDAAKEAAGAPLQILSLLADKSLLRKTPSGRYRVHPMVRQFAEEQWGEAAAEKDRALDLHAAYYAGMLKRREVDLKGGKQKEALSEIGQELENVRAAWTRLAEKRDEEQIAAVLHPFYLFFRMQSRLHEGEETFAKAAALLKREGVVAHRLLARQGVFCYMFSQYEKAEALVEKALSFFRRHKIPEEVAFCLSTRGRIAYQTGKYAEARALEQEGLAIYRGLNDRPGTAVALIELGDIAFNLGEYAEARKLYDESYAIFSELGDQLGIANTIRAKGFMAYTLGDYSEAGRLLQEGLAIANEIGSKRMILLCQHLLGITANRKGELETARRYLEECLSNAREIGDRLFAAASMEDFGNVVLRMGERERGIELLKESLAISRDSGNKWQWGFSLCSMANVAEESGELEMAWGYLRESLTIAMEISGISLILRTLAGMAALYLKEGKKENAMELIPAILNHHAADREIKDRVENLCSTYGIDSSETSVSRKSGEVEAIFEIAARLLHRR